MYPYPDRSSTWYLSSAISSPPPAKPIVTTTTQGTAEEKPMKQSSQYHIHVKPGTVCFSFASRLPNCSSHLFHRPSLAGILIHPEPFGEAQP